MYTIYSFRVIGEERKKQKRKKAEKDQIFTYGFLDLDKV